MEGGFTPVHCGVTSLPLIITRHITNEKIVVFHELQRTRAPCYPVVRGFARNVAGVRSEHRPDRARRYAATVRRCGDQPSGGGQDGGPLKAIQRSLGIDEFGLSTGTLDGAGRWQTVSYTHLDVYKRQVKLVLLDILPYYFYYPSYYFHLILLIRLDHGGKESNKKRN